MSGAKRRLAALRRQIGAAVPASPGSGDLAARIDRLRVTGKQKKGRFQPGDALLADRLGGRVLSPGLVLIEQRLPLATRHGVRPLSLLNQRLDGLPGGYATDPRALLFLDSETTGLSGGSGTLAFMLGMACVERDSLVIRQYILSRFCGEQALLQAAGEWAGGRQTLVSYNGRSFDLPLLATRYRMAGLSDSLSGIPQLDLLHPVRRAFSGRWEDCRLATVERRLMGYHRADDLPGSQAPGAWSDWIRLGDPRRLPGVVRHNRWDILSLVVLMPVLASVYREPASHQVNQLAMARDLGRIGCEARALSLLQSNQQQLSEEALLELARLLKKRGQPATAFPIWQRLADAGSEQAREQLAKYYEHVTRDYRSALAWALRLPVSEGHLHRCRRLRRKLARVEGRQLFESRR